MKILVLGGGLMGPAAALRCMAEPDVDRVAVADASAEALTSCLGRLDGKPGSGKLDTLRLDLRDPGTAREIAGFDAVISALPSSVNRLGIQSALAARRPLVDLSGVRHDAKSQIDREAREAGVAVVLGCGLEPGLTEIWARHLGERLDRADELHIRCGGIPQEPEPPLNYKIVFGGKHLPFEGGLCWTLSDGRLQQVPAYSGVETVVFDGVGTCEAWNDGLARSLMELPAFAGLRQATQKTVRWPGYAAMARFFQDFGLLGTDPIPVNGTKVVPLDVLTELLYPRLVMGGRDRDLVAFRVEAVGDRGGSSCRLRAEMVDRFDETSGLTAMARTTAFPAAVAALMLARGTARRAGLFAAERFVEGDLFGTFMKALEESGIRFAVSESMERSAAGS